MLCGLGTMGFGSAATQGLEDYALNAGRREVVKMQKGTGRAIKIILLIGFAVGILLNEWILGFGWGAAVAYVTRPKVPPVSPLTLSPSPAKPPGAA